MLKTHNRPFLLLFQATDLVLVLLTLFLSDRVYSIICQAGWVTGPNQPAGDLYRLAVVAVLLVPFVFSYFSLYQPHRMVRLSVDLVKFAFACGTAWLLAWSLSYLAWRISFKRGELVIWLMVWISMGVLWRFAVRGLLRTARKRGWNLRNAAILGTGRIGQKVLYELQENPWCGVEVTHFIAVPPCGKTVRGIPVLPWAGSLRETLGDGSVDYLFVAVRDTDRHILQDVFAEAEKMDVTLQLVPDWPGRHVSVPSVTWLGDLQVLSLYHTTLYGKAGAFKRLIDVVVSGLLLLILSPLLITIALAIKLTSKGPVLFRQKRSSLGGKNFHIYKFRSMRVDDPATRNPNWTKDKDPRITLIGKFIRKTNIDELPQLWNVLKGQMSLVGPRPEQPQLADRFNRILPRYAVRNLVRPGLTGWAQINGYRGNTSLRKRLQHDLYYIRNWSIGFDLWILFRTLVQLPFFPRTPEKEMEWPDLVDISKDAS